MQALTLTLTSCASPNPNPNQLCKHVAADDGTFWISLEDFVQQFDNVDVCQRSKVKG